MEPLRKWQRDPGLGVAILLALYSGARYFLLLRLPVEQLVAYIPDDAFYELQIARHFLTTGRWSFDSGFSSTTGFHLLNVYLMALLPTTLTDPPASVHFWMGADLALWIASIFVICRFIATRFGTFALLPVILVLTANTLQTDATSLLEFPFVVLIASLYVRTLFSTSGSPPHPIFLLGLMGSLARSDFGGLPFACAVGIGVAELLRHRNTNLLRRSIWGLAGATLGLVVCFAHTFFLSSHLLSGSVRAKELWGQRAGYSLIDPFKVLIMTAASSASDLFLVAVLLVVAAIIALAQGSAQKASDGGPELRLIAGAGALTIILYLLVYGFDPATQIWYAANFAVPLILVSAFVAKRVASVRFAGPVVAAACIVGTVFHLAKITNPIWPNQPSEYRMAQFVSAQPPSGRLAGFNVGIPGYFLDGKVINLDGLMNDQIYPDLRTRMVEQYLDRNQINYLMDFPEQYENPRFGKMLGYDPARLRARLVAVRVEKSETLGNPWKNYTLSRIEPEPH